MSHHTTAPLSTRPRPTGARFARRARRRVLVPLAALGGAVALTGTAAASTPPGSTAGPDSGSDAIILVDAGDQSHTIVLPGVPAVGTTGQHTSISTASGTIQASGSDDSEATIDVVTTITQEGEIVAAGADGFQLRRTVRSYEVVDNSVGASGDSYANDTELAQLIDIPLLADFDARGSLQSLSAAPEVTITPEQQAAIDTAFEGANRVGFPEAPVGVGARWEAVLGSGDSEFTATYTLTALDGDDYTMEVTMAATAEQFTGGAVPDGFDEVRGSLSGSGEFHGRVGEPFARSASTTLTIDLTFVGEDIEVASAITMVEEETTVPG